MSRLLLTVTLGSTLCAEASGRPPVAYDFTLRDSAGALYRLSKMVRRRPVLLDFFRTDCAPCLAGLAKLEKLSQTLRGRVDVVVIALLEQDEGRRRLDAFLKRRRLGVKVLIDAYDTVAKRYIDRGKGVILPSFVLVDRAMRIRLRGRTPSNILRALK